MEPKRSKSAKNIRTGLILASVAAVFFIGFFVRRIYFG
ncbi:MAG: cytochrome oxidase small assembly protein [Burkholderiales bacterium]